MSQLSKQLQLRLALLLVLGGLATLLVNYRLTHGELQLQARQRAFSITHTLEFATEGLISTTNHRSILRRVVQNYATLAQILEVAIVRPDGNTEVSAPGGAESFRYASRHPALAEAMAQASSSGINIHRELRIHGKPVLANIMPFTSALFHQQSGRGLIIVLLDLGTIERDARAVLSISTLPMGAGLIVILVLMGYVIRQMVLVPLARLNHAVLDSHKGASFTIPEAMANNEIRFLATSFDQVVNQLAIQLEQSRRQEHELQESNRELRRIQASLESRTAELLEAKKGADIASQAKSSFLANMSHELRTPLNAVLGYAQLMSRDNELPARHRDAVKTIMASGEHLLLMLGDVLDIARIEAGRIELHPSIFTLPAFLDTLSALFELRARQRHLTFRRSVGPNLPLTIRCDETRLRQILINLLSNAVKFTERGSVSLEVSFDGERLRFQVQDSGIGIPVELQETIFQPFEQVTHSTSIREGTGLGLAISQQLVSLMGGRIHVDSAPGRGSTFWFEITPEILSDWQPPQVPQQIIVGYEPPVRTLLIADDKPRNLQLLRDFFEPLGFRLLTARDGQEALELIQAERPDLVFMDLVMPRLDGFEAMRRIRSMKEVEGIRIIAASASVVEREQERCQEAGCDAFVPKPIALDAALELVGKLLGLAWRYRDKAPRSAPAAPASAAPGQLHTPVAQPSRLTAQALRCIYEATSIGDIQVVLSVLGEAGVHEPASDDSSLEASLWRLAKRFQNRKIRALIAPLIEGSEEAQR